MKVKRLRIRQLLSIILCLAMLFANVPSVFAEGTVTLSSPVTVNKGNLSTYQNAVLTTNGTAKPEDSLLVFDGVKVTVVLENFKVQINAPAGYTCRSGIVLKNGADVTLILRGENLAQGKYGGAGIEVPGGCKLTISSQSTGSLNAIGGSLYGGGAGIGARGNDYSYYYPENTQEVTCGDIIIDGGTINAVGATMTHQFDVIGSAAGIGGSWLSTGGTVTINGGTVNATGGNFSPGIGAGSTSILERITITGGVVNSSTTGSLTMDRKAAGLGAGVNSDRETKTGVKNITITGGTINVTGKLGLSDLLPNTVGYLDCNMQLSEEANLTVSDGIDPMGNMFWPQFRVRLEDLSIFQSVAGQLRVSDGTGNAVVEQSITLNKSGDGIFTCNISKYLYSERKGGAYTLALTVNGTTYTESFTMAESNEFTFGPGIGTAELVFRSNYLEKTLENVTVTVKDPVTGQNVADAMISGERKITYVAPTQGVMTLKLTPGKYVVTVTAPELNGGQPMEKEITVTKGETTTAYMLNENVVEIPEQLVLDNGNIVFGIEQDIPFLSYYNDNKEQKKIYNYPATLEYEIIQRSQDPIGNTITVNYGSVRMKLRGLNVNAGVPVAVLNGAAAAISLSGANTLAGTSGPGIHVAAGTALTLDGTGTLTVSGTNAAGIGGKNDENNGTITINGGTINATGGRSSAGIGTGNGSKSGGQGGKITINGGTIVAQGGIDGAGVGTGFRGNCVIEINGGSVNGTGRENSAGIGAGEYGTVTINITGGKAEGQGAERAAGIGSAYHSGASAINISGGTVIGKAWPEQGDEGAGIGGGNNADTMIITITGGTVEGYGGDAASGIGSGSNCIRPAKVYIRDGDVKGYGRQRYAAGIGGGGDGAVVEISGGTVLAEAWNYAAGIGGGDSKHAGTILISGGHVTAIGPAWDGAAIGSYIDAVGGSITITGGTVVATNDTSNVPAIGGANTITISGGTVTATADRGGAGIGGAAEQPSGTINISGGVITASSADEGAGIGAGYKGTLGEINISGGIITATGGFAAAGIGGGWRSAGGTINISGGTITATGDYNGAGIGGGYASNDMQIVITGGNIKATAGTNAQAVGKGGSATGTATVTNGTENVSLNTIILHPVPSDGKIKSITGIPGYYGLKDMQVLDSNRIYLYLPTNTTITAVQAGDETFEGSVSGVGTLTAHIHNWSYSVSGKTITVSCENTDGKCKEPDGGSVSLTVPADREYNGQQAEATYTGSLKTTDSVQISYATAEGQPLNDAPVDAGSYTACLHAGGKQVEDTFTISPRTVTVTAAACGKTYGDADPKLTYAADGLLNDDSLTGELKRVAGENVGTYAIEQNTLSVDKNYTISFTGAELTIHAKPITEADVQLNGSLTYTGSEQTQAVTVADGITYEVTGNKATAAGSYELTVTGTGNFSGTVTRTFTIGKAAAAAVAPTAKELTYTGLAQNLVTAGTTNDGTMVYSLTENGQYTAEIPTGTNTGKYTVYYKVVGDENHSDTAVDSIEVTIAKADPVIGTVGCKMPLFDSTDISTVELTRTDMSVDGTLILTDAKLTVGEGTYNWKFTPEDTDNYNTITGTVVLTVTADVLEQIRATGTLEKFSYVYGEPFSIDGMTVTASYTSGSTKDVTGLVSFDRTLAVGQTAVELTYQGKICVIDGITVARKQLDVSGMAWDVPENAVYSGTAYTATLTGELPEGVTVTKTGNTATNAGDYTAKAVFSLAEGYSADNYEIVNGEDLTAEWSIDKAALTITADSYESVRYGSAAPAFAVNYSGFVNGETEAVLGGELVFSCEYDTANAAKRKPGDYPIVPSGLTSNNYEISYVDGNLEVILANLVIVIDDKTVTYGDAAPEYTYHYEGFVYGEDISVMDEPGTVSCAYVTGNAVGTMEIKSDNYGSDDCYFVVNQRIGTLTVEKAPLIVTAKDNTITYGDKPSARGVEYSGFVNNETESVLTGTVAYSYNYEQFGNVGTYKITPVGLTSDNYEITFADGTLTVNAKAITVTADAVSKTYGDTDPTLTYTAQGLVNGDELTGELKRAAGENVGSYAIEQNTLTAGNNYSITYTGAKLTINKRSVTVTAKDQTLTYGETISGTEITVNGLVDGNSVTVTLTPSTANVTVDGTITASAAIITAGTADVTANYEITYAGGKLVIEPDMSKIAGLTTDNVTSANEADIKAVQEMMAKADSVKDEWAAISNTCEDLIEKIEAVEAQKKEATDKAASFDADTVKSTDKANLTQLAEEIEVLLDTDNLTEDERTALETVLGQVNGMIDTIEDTAEDSKAATEAIDALDAATVTSADKGKLEQAIETIEDLLAGNNLTEEERKALEDAQADAKALIDVISAAAGATDTENTEKVEDVTPENVTPEDKTDLEKAKADLEKALEDNDGNYTEDEKKAIQEDIDRIESAITALENVENVTEAIAQLPESVEPDNEAEAEKILAAKEGYEALTDHEKSLVSEDAKKKLEDLVASLTAYDIVKGDGSSWTEDSNSTISFTANGAFSKFVGIKVDGVDVDKADYEAKAGSTIITLKASYLDTLKVGEHTITVVYNDGSTDGTFKIVAKPNTPATGDDFNIALYGSLMAVSVSALVVLLLVSKKRKYAK